MNEPKPTEFPTPPQYSPLSEGSRLLCSRQRSLKQSGRAFTLRGGGRSGHVRSRACTVPAGAAFSSCFPARAGKRGEDRAKADRLGSAERCPAGFTGAGDGTAWLKGKQ